MVAILQFGPVLDEADRRCHPLDSFVDLLNLLITETETDLGNDR